MKCENFPADFADFRRKLQSPRSGLDLLHFFIRKFTQTPKPET